MAHTALRLLMGLGIVLFCLPASAQEGGETPPPAAPAAEPPPAAPAPAPAAAPPPATPAPAAPAVTAPPPAAPPPAAAPPASNISDADKQRANALWDEGQALYGQGRYKEAIDRFQQAYEILRDVNLLYSTAIAYQQLESWSECVNYMDRFIEKAPLSPKKDRAITQRRNCKARIVRDQQLIIDSDPPGAKVYVDDRRRGVVGTTPYSNYVNPGAHIVWIELEGYEPIRQEIEVQVKEPFRLNLALRKVQNLGWLHVDCTVIDAQVYIDGKNVGLSPFKEPLPYSAGRHQVVVTRDGYTRFDEHVSVEKGATTRVNAYLVRTETVSSWRSGLGWTSNVLGVLALAGGGVAYYFADQEFNDTARYDELVGYQNIGYGVGGGLLAIGIGLLIWDANRDVILDKDKNPYYEQPVTAPGGTSGIGSAPRRAPFPGLGFTF
ncbi:MAG: PEGA domain-containing protein [Bradymonadia bacterium]